MLRHLEPSQLPLRSRDSALTELNFDANDNISHVPTLLYENMPSNKKRRLRRHAYLTPKDTQHSSWHACYLTQMWEAGMFEQCATCRIRKWDFQDRPLGVLELLPVELRAIVYGFLIPPPLPLSTNKMFQEEEREMLSTRHRYDALPRAINKDIWKRCRQQKNPLNIMATSKAVYAEIKNLPAFRNRLFSVTFTCLGMSFEKSLPQIEPFTSDPQKLMSLQHQREEGAYDLRWPFKALHVVSPRRLHATFPIPITEWAPSAQQGTTATVGLSLTALSHFLGLLIHDRAIHLNSLHIRLFLYDPEFSTTRQQPGIGWDIDMQTMLFHLFSVSKTVVGNVTVSIDSDQPDSHWRQKWWWTAPLVEVAHAIVEKRNRLTEAQRANFDEKERRAFREELQERMIDRMTEACAAVNEAS